MRDGRQRAPQPPSITVIGDMPRRGEPGYRDKRGPSPERLEMVRRWPRRGVFFLIVFGAGWIGSLGVAYASMFTSGTAWLEMLFSLVDVAAALGILYLALSQLFNRTRIVVEGGKLSVSHGPLPLPGNLELDVDRVRQLFVHRRSKLGRSGTGVEYSVCAFVGDFAVDLVRGLASHDEARFIEQVIEDHLAIADDPRANVME